LFLVVAGANDEVIREAGDAGEIEDFDVGGFLGFGGANGDQPGGPGEFQFAGGLRVRFGQKKLCSCPYPTTVASSARLQAQSGDDQGRG
jgi:hypothetical protein